LKLKIVLNINLNNCLGVTPTSALSFLGNSIGKKIQTPSRDDGDYRLI